MILAVASVEGNSNEEEGKGERKSLPTRKFIFSILLSHQKLERVEIDNSWDIQ